MIGSVNLLFGLGLKLKFAVPAARDRLGRELMQPETILVVDDDDVLRNRLEKSFTKRGWIVFIAEGFEQALEIAIMHKPDRAVLDLKMPGKSGLNVLREIREASPETKCVILTGYGSITNAVEAVKLGAVGYVTKPADADQVLAAFDESSTGTPTPDFPPPSLAEAHWEHIQRVLSDSGGNISEAARRLDIPRRTLQRKLKKNAP
jgi:two-component system response regulator RegA